MIKVSFRIAIVLLAIAVSLIACDLFRSDENLSFEECISKATDYRNKGDVEKAISYYKKALKVRPEDANTHFTLGEYYQQEYFRSLDDSQRRAQMDAFINPNRTRKRENAEKELIEVFGLKKEYEQLAIKEFRETLKYDPNNWMARYYVATNLLNNKHYTEAIEEYKLVIELNPSWATPYGLIGESYRKIHSYNFAINYLEKAIELDPNFEHHYYQLALVYRKMNNGAKVNEMLKKLKSMNSIFYDELRLRLFKKNDDD